MKDILKRIHPRLYIALSGLLIGLSIIFAEVGFISYFALIPLACALYGRARSGDYRAKRAYLDGFIFYMCFDIVAFHWFIYFYPLDFAGIDDASAIFVILLAWVGLSALQSAFSAFTFVIISRFIRTSVYKKYPALLAPFAAAIFAVNEWTQTFTWAGVPWARIAISQTEMPILMQSASLFGSYFLTFTVVAFNFFAALIILCPDKRRKYAALTLFVFAYNTLLGTVLYFVPTFDESRELKVASIQGNEPSQDVYSTLGETYQNYLELTEAAVVEGAELVIWPEGVFAVDIHAKMKTNDGKYDEIANIVSGLAQKLDVTIVIGTYVDGEKTCNTAVSIFYSDGSSSINAYAKRRPVPFGEFLPMGKLVYAVAPVLAKINIFYDLVPGESSDYFTADSDEDSIRVGTLICFDSIYERLGIDSAREGAEIFIVPSNDSWFYDSRAIYMHHSQNILRAVEQGKYTVNCGNTGVTSVINDKGEVINEIPIFTRGYVIDTVYASSGRTLYSYIGNLFVYICIAAIIAPFAYDIAKKKSFKF